MNLVHIEEFTVYMYDKSLVGFIFDGDIYYADCCVTVKHYDEVFSELLYGIFDRKIEKDRNMEIAKENNVYIDENEVLRTPDVMRTNSLNKSMYVHNINKLNNLVIVGGKVCAVKKDCRVHYVDVNIHCVDLKDISELDLDDSIRRNERRKYNRGLFQKLLV